MGRFDGAPVDRAAGGVVLRDGSVLVVHRPRHDDWSLPKGHVDDGETWAETAVREVLEETGVSTTIVGPPVTTAYPLPQRGESDELSTISPTVKVVLFFPMSAPDPDAELAGDPDEVDEVAWWPVERALRGLSYAGEQAVLRSVVGESGGAPTG